MSEIPALAFVAAGIFVDIFSVYVGSHSSIGRFISFMIFGTALIAFGIYKIIFPPDQSFPKTRSQLDEYIEQRKAEINAQMHMPMQPQRSVIQPAYNAQYREVNPQYQQYAPVNPYMTGNQPLNPYSRAYVPRGTRR